MVIRIRTRIVKRIRRKNKNVGVDWRGFCWVRDSFLGKGGFGSVFLVKREQGADDSEFPSVMAVKTASMEKASTLEREKKILCNFSTASPYVIGFYGDKETDVEVGENGGQEKTYNLFLEFCSGGSLYDRIKNSVNGLTEHEVRGYTRDIVRGLDYIHGKGIVHCDIKPDNILLVPKETGGGFTAKLADFGLAKNVDYEEEENSALRGTLSYMSPELVRDRLLTYPADIWALGCVAVEMMTGKSAWDCEFASEDDLLHHIAFSSEIPEFPYGISEEGEDFLGKCLVRNFSLRWSAEQLLQHPFLAV